MAVYDLSSSYEHVGEGFVAESRKTLRGAARRIEHGLSQLSDEDVWWRPHESMNAAGNIVLHVCGNVSQWIVSGVGGHAYERDRPAEFACRDSIPADQLLAQFRQTIDRADEVLSVLTEPQLLETRRIQSFDTSVLAAVYHAVSHLEGHAQEMIYIARQRLGDRYRFLWQPTHEQQTTS